jgi:hypothetical protein
MNDIIHKIYYIDDIFRYLLEFLNFDDKIAFGKLVNKNLVKNIDIFNKKYNKKLLSEYFYICGDCFDNLSNDMYHSLIYKYNNFLSYNNENSDDTENSDDEYTYANNDIIIRSSVIKDQIEFIYSNCYYIAVRAFLEILDSKNIILNNENNKCILLDKIHKIDMKLDYDSYNSCIFHLELNEDTYELIYDKMQDIYENAITNNLLDIFCEKCGIFGHCSLSNKCVLYNEYYEKQEIKNCVKDIINDIIIDVIKIYKKKKIIRKKKKHLCKSCNVHFYNKNCENKLCGGCCKCNDHKK